MTPETAGEPSAEVAAGAKRSRVRSLLHVQGTAWALAARTAMLPITTLFRRAERHLLWRLHAVLWGAERSGVYPEVSLPSLMDRADVVRILELPSEVYHISEAKLLALAALTSHARVRTVFEIGTADGRTTRNLAANIDPSSHVYTLSLPLEQDAVHRQLQHTPIGVRFQGSPEAECITQLWGDSLAFDFTPYLGRCQVVFIDAGNTDASVWANSQTALHLVDRNSGLIVWNDALSYGTRTALPRLMHQKRLPVHLISGTGLAILCFVDGAVVAPHQWSQHQQGRERERSPEVPGRS